MTQQCFDIDGYGFPFYRVTHYYAVEESNGTWQWGYKLDNGVFEFFPHSTEEAARKEHDRFVLEFNIWLGNQKLSKCLKS